MADVRLPTTQVANRYGVSTRSVERWQRDSKLDFPKPILINNRKYWPLSSIEAWERKRAAGLEPQAA